MAKSKIQFQKGYSLSFSRTMALGSVRKRLFNLAFSHLSAFANKTCVAEKAAT